MTVIKFCTRSFHPDANFGAGGLGFEGDDRGFSFDLTDTSRIYHLMDLNLQTGRIEAVICDSDPSANAIADKVINAGAEVAAAGLGIPISSIVEGRVPDVPPMANDYSQPRKKPRHEETKSITAYTEDGDQTANITIKYAGKNFAFYWADTDIGHAVLGGPLSNEEANDVGSGKIAGGRIPFNGVVPDLDVTNQLFLLLDRATGKASVHMTMTGDGFPNAESFIIGSDGEILGLATHIRTGTAISQLPGGRSIRMCRTQLDDVDWSKTDTLGSSAKANAVHDYMSYSTTEVVEGNIGRAKLNSAHLSRNASGNFLRQVQDNIPLPTLRTLEGLFD